MTAPISFACLCPRKTQVDTRFQGYQSSLLPYSNDEEPKETTPADAEELLLLARRRHLICLAILFAVIAALLVCFVVAGAFLGALIAADLTRLVAALFILAMGSMIAALSLFLREIYLAVSAGSR